MKAEKSTIDNFIVENMGVLEEILDRTARQYMELHKKRRSLDFGPRLSKKDLKSLTLEVAAGTSDVMRAYYKPDFILLKVFDIPRDSVIALGMGLGVYTLGTIASWQMPQFWAWPAKLATLGALSYLSSLYLLSTKTSFYMHRYGLKFIIVGTNTQVKAVGDIAHEYTHFIQDSFRKAAIFEDKYLREGYARAVEGCVAGKYAEEKDNPAYLYGYLARAASDLKYAYLHYCEKEGITPKESLTRLKTPRRFLHKLERAHAYHAGVSCVLIAKELYGDSVYSDVLFGISPFLKIKRP